MFQDSLFSVFGQRLSMAIGDVVGLTSIAGQQAITIKLLSGGTLEIGGQSQTAGQLYPLSAGEIMNMNFAGKFWLYCTGAPVTIGILMGKSDGV